MSPGFGVDCASDRLLRIPITTADGRSTPDRGLKRKHARGLISLLCEWRGSSAGQSYVALFDRARLLVLDGRIATGTRLTAEGDLAQALIVSHRMVFDAYLELRDAGYNSSAGYGGRTIAPRAEQPLARYAPQAPAAS